MTDYWVTRVGNEAPELVHEGPSKDTSSRTWYCVHRSGGNLHDQCLDGSIRDYVEQYAKSRGAKLFFEKYAHDPGSYHPRIWRLASRPLTADETRALTSAATSMAALFTLLEEIFLTIEPDRRNDSSYGHRLRQFLILACTEVEAAWTGILKANNYPGSRWNTNDYVKLLPLMKLNEWSTSLISYPDYPAVVPFAAWDAANPTGSLGWYDAYNRSKHDREGNLHAATMRDVINAAAAMLILAAAQFGPDPWHPDDDLARYRQHLFSMDWPKNWTPHEHYYPPEHGHDWKAVPIGIP